jgi:PAS domain S-box-containing protein
LLKNAAEIAKIGAWSFDISKNQLNWSDQLAKIHEKEPVYQPNSQEAVKYVLPKWRDKVVSEFEKAYKHGQEIDVTFQIETANKNIKWVRSIGYPIKNDEGQIIKLEGALQDITEYKEIENKLRINEEKHRVIVQNAPIITFIIDKDGIFQLSEGSALSKLGLKPGQVVGLSAYDVYKDFPEIINSIKQAFEGNSIKHELFISDAYFEVNYIPLNNPDGTIDRIIGVANDITNRKRNEIKIIELNESLEKKVNERTEELKEAFATIEIANTELTQLNEELTNESRKLLKLNEKLLKSEQELKDSIQVKDRFFSIVSHDLRSALGGFLGLTDLLAENFNDLDDNEKVKLSKMIRDNVQRFNNFMENLLEWSRLQMKRVSFHPVETQISLNLDIVLNLYESKFRDKNIEIINMLDKNLKVYADNNMLQVVLRNLISNALKFTHEGGKIAISSMKNDNDQIIISIKDTGVGMSDETIIKLFRMDTKFTTSGTANEKGTGLGLLLVKEIIEIHKGKIWVESKEGIGSARCREFCIHSK